MIRVSETIQSKSLNPEEISLFQFVYLPALIEKILEDFFGMCSSVCEFVNIWRLVGQQTPPFQSSLIANYTLSMYTNSDNSNFSRAVHWKYSYIRVYRWTTTCPEHAQNKYYCGDDVRAIDWWCQWCMLARLWCLVSRCAWTGCVSLAHNCWFVAPTTNMYLFEYRSSWRLMHIICSATTVPLSPMCVCVRNGIDIICVQRQTVDTGCISAWYLLTRCRGSTAIDRQTFWWKRTWKSECVSCLFFTNIYYVVSIFVYFPLARIVMLLGYLHLSILSSLLLLIQPNDNFWY